MYILMQASLDILEGLCLSCIRFTSKLVVGGWGKAQGDRTSPKGSRRFNAGEPLRTRVQVAYTPCPLVKMFIEKGP